MSSKTQRETKIDRRIAPFPIEQLVRASHRAKWEDVAKAAQALRKRQKREIPDHLDVRSASFWFAELNVLWNGDTVYAYVADEEDSPWYVEWSCF